VAARASKTADGAARIEAGLNGESMAEFMALDRPVGDCVAIEPSSPTGLYGLPADMANPPPHTAPLFVYRDAQGRATRYSLAGDLKIEGSKRDLEPICRVWRTGGSE
jgi:hypothetical protein